MAPSVTRRPLPGFTDFKRPRVTIDPATGLPYTGGSPSGFVLQDTNGKDWYIWPNSTNGGLRITDAASAEAASYNFNTGTSTVSFPGVVASGRSAAATAAVATVTSLLVGAADASYIVSMNVLVTTATTHTFTGQVTYTDEGNTARTITMPFRLVGDTTALTSSITNGNGAVPYIGVPLHIRVKAATTITILTQAAGTYTTVVFNVEGFIQQVG